MENTPPASYRPMRRRTAGFTIVEVVIAACLLATFVCASVAVLAQINRWATAARLRTLALAVAQQRLDQVQTVGWQGTVLPTVLASNSTENNLPLNNDDFNSETGLSSAFTSLDGTVNATRTTQITTISARLLRVMVTVSFTYRNRPYTVSLTTLRASDSI